MKDQDKTKSQLIRELETLRHRISELEAVESASQDTEKRLWKHTRALHERVKELKCLYGISNLFERNSHSLAEVLQGTTDLILHAWQHPEVACARITLDSDRFATANFRETEWKQAGDIVVHGERIGSVTVCYLEERPQCDEGPFLEEERSLLLEIIERLEKHIEHTRVEEEVKVKQEKLIQADKMVSLGFLVSGVAHEINNPNNFIRLNAPILKEAWESITPILEEYYNENGDFIVAGIPYNEMRKELPKLLMGILEGSERIMGIVQELKDYARHEKADATRHLNVNMALETTLDLLSNQIRKSTSHLTVVLEENLPSVRGSFQRLGQVLVNLILNACQALSDPGQGIFITTARENSSGGILVEIRDEGIGIPHKDLNSIFDPFFTTKHDMGGTGLGLFICANITRELGGSLTYDSELGKGTRARLLLPATAMDEADNVEFPHVTHKTNRREKNEQD